MSKTDFYEVLIVLTVIAVIIIAGVALSSASCKTRGQSFDDVEYSVIGGCMVKHHDKWLPIDNIRGFDDK